MKLKIKASGFFSSRSLTVNSAGVTFSGYSFLSNNNFNFKEIDYILMSDNYELSLQIKQEVFTIPVKPDKDKHKKVITALLQEVRRASVISAA